MIRIPRVLTLVAAVLVAAAGPLAQQSATTDLRLLSAAIGPDGVVKDGRFVLNEERATFNRTDEKQLVISFQWEGTPGVHRMIATWRGPDGTVSSSAPVEYEAKDRRFAAYWTFALSPNMSLGTWHADVTVNGQPGGRLAFEITGVAAPAVARKQILTHPQLFEVLNAMHVVLQRSTSTGRQLDHGAALLGANGQLHTASSAIDEADRIQAHAASGDPRPISSVVAWSRLGRWAVLASGLPAPGTKVSPADATQTRVGDRCYALDGSVTGARVLLDGAVSGRTAGARSAWIVGFQNGDARPGSPVVNESGELLGIIDGPTDTFQLLRERRDLRGSPILPFGDIKVPDQAAAVALDDLRARGELIPPVLGDAHVVSGGFAAGINRGPIVAPSDQRSEFSTMEKTVTVFVTWSPHERLRGMMTLTLFDANNRPIFQSPPKKSDLRKQNLLLTSWQLTMLRTPGVYRADVMLENRVMWRGYVRLTS